MMRNTGINVLKLCFSFLLSLRTNKLKCLVLRNIFSLVNSFKSDVPHSVGSLLDYLQKRKKKGEKN
jgi:hypothetical protein